MTPAATQDQERRRILCLGSIGADDGGDALVDLVLGLAGRGAPRICFLGTASGDRSDEIARFYLAFGRRACEPSHVSLVRHAMPPARMAAHLLRQDAILAGPGDLVSLLAIWRSHGVDRVLHQAWEGGIVLAGAGAGASCWFEQATAGPSDSPRPTSGLGFLPGALMTPAGDDATARRQWFDAVGGDGAAFVLGPEAGILFRGTGRFEALAGHPDARAYRLDSGGEAPLNARLVEAAPRPHGPSAIEEFRRVRMAQREAKERARRRRR